VGDPHARRLVRATLHTRSLGKRTMFELPGNAARRPQLAVNADLARTLRVAGSQPEVVLSPPVDLPLEALGRWDCGHGEQSRKESS
jgi:hypothetical protein